MILSIIALIVVSALVLYVGWRVFRDDQRGEIDDDDQSGWGV